MSAAPRRQNQTVVRSLLSMLDLQSPRWAELNGAVAAQLIQQVRDGDEDAYAELYHQACHQFTVAPAAYAVVPHLADLAANTASKQLWPLITIGSVVAARAAHPKTSPAIPNDLRVDYERAVSAALPRLPSPSVRGIRQIRTKSWQFSQHFRAILIWQCICLSPVRS